MRGTFYSVHFRRGLTLIDVLVVVFVCVMLIGVTAGVAGRSRETANRVKCASNLRQIGQALLLYANENRGLYPMTQWDQLDPTPRAYTGAMAINPFASNGPSPNDVTAMMFLLLRTQDISAEVFTCPYGYAERWDYNGNAGGALAFSNFPDGRYVSYSMHNPYVGQAMAEKYKWNNTLAPDFIVAADINPGVPELLTTPSTAPRNALKKLNSPNHAADGQNFLGGDGHAEFVVTPYAGIGKDNMYTFGGPGQNPGIQGPPVSQEDSILLPVATVIPPLIGEVSSRTMAIVIASLVLAMIAFLAALFYRREVKNV